MTQSALNKLVEKNGFEVFVIYLRNVLKAFDIVLVKKEEYKQLHELQLMIFNSFTQMLKREPYYRFAEKESVVELVRYLEDALYRV